MKTNKLTKRQAAIVGAHTGILMGKFSDLHEYIEEIMGRGVFTHELSDKKIVDKIKSLSSNDFLSICAD